MTRNIPLRSFFYLALLALAVFYLLPVYLMVLTGLKPFSDVDLKTMWTCHRLCALKILLRVTSSLAPT
jgi:glucose/mannose transport system permease protein